MQRHRGFLLALVGALLCTAGNLLAGWAPATDLANRLTMFFSSLLGLPIWRLGLCAMLGIFGMLLQGAGYLSIYGSFEDRENLRGRLYLGASLGGTILGAIFHLLLCTVIFLWNLGIPEPQNTLALSQFFLWFCLPVTLLVLVSQLMLSLLLALQLGGGHSSFPRACGLLNPLLLQILIWGLLSLLPGSAPVNGLFFAGPGLASLLFFGGLLLCKP